jgi:signal transduction histidine kinase
MWVSAETVASRDHRLIVAESLKQFPDPELMSRSIEQLHESFETLHDDFVLSDGRIIDRYSAPVLGGDGTHVGRVTFFRDITVERTANDEMRSAWAAAEAASKAKSMFLANMSHELRTPLNAVIGLADLLLLDSGDPTTKRQREYLEAVTQSGRHLLALVNDVLDLAKIEADKQELELETVGVRDAVEEVLAALVPLAHHRGISVFIHISRSVRDVRADRLRLRQVLYNLMTNALNFTDRGGSVTISGKNDGERIAISVADTGIGIAETDLPRLFRAFEQLAPHAGDRPTGTGLGLALTRRLVDMHGGTIDVASQVGVGTTFTVRLPAG